MADTVYDLSPAAAATHLGVHEDTVKRWVKAGKLAAIRTPGGWLRFSRVDLDAFLAARRVGDEPEAKAG